MRGWLRIVLGVIVVPWSTPAAAERIRLEYGGTAFSVIPLGKATLDFTLDEDGYRAAATIQSGGLVALFDRTRLSARAEGDLGEDGALAWRRFELDHAYAKKRRVTDMRPVPGDVAALITPPHRDPEDIKPTSAQKAQARDPLSSLAAMAAQVGETGNCAGVFPTFDGRFRYDLILRREGTDTHRGGGYVGPVLKCKLRYQPVAGYRTPEDMARRIPEGEIWFALIAGARIAPPVRMTAPLPLGWAGIYLTGYRTAAVEIAAGE